jgi:uncharacterized SAM-binding protein YcdF (DUF218 family)
MIRVFILTCLVVAAAVLFWGAARYLVINSPARSELIVVLGGGDNRGRIEKAFRLLQDGYGKRVLLDDNMDKRVFGRTRGDLAQDFVQHLNEDLARKVDVCLIEGTSTLEETKYVANCVSRYRAQSVLLVTSDYDTRRALSIFARRLPQYGWSIAAATNPSKFGNSWWRHRQWAKFTVTEWGELIWWELIDRW